MIYNFYDIGVDAPALDALAQELSVRLHALRAEATALLQALPDDSVASAEDAIEVATTCRGQM